MGELDLDKIERLLNPEWQKKHPREEHPLIKEQDIVDETPPPEDGGCKCLAKAG
ncbi:MAG: hypothetical protein PVJ61_02905 [Dehalococcoidia bacterium]|jgi:hypothetical protein